MFIINRLTRFKLNYKVIIDNQISKIVSYNSPIFVMNRNGLLLNNLHTNLTQTMRKRILIYFLQITVSMKDMDRISCLSYLFNHSQMIIAHVVLSFYVFSAFSAVNYSLSSLQTNARIKPGIT